MFGFSNVTNGRGGNEGPLVLEINGDNEQMKATTINGEEKTPTLVSGQYKGTGNTQDGLAIQQSAVVRRLTPLECERLQGFPDNWTNIGDWTDSKGKKHKGNSDAPRYKALGNSIALPFWAWMSERMTRIIKEDNGEEYVPTMASLFDGIGGFPLVFSRCGCSPIWASEIEEFPIAVTKIRFPEVGEDDENI